MEKCGAIYTECSFRIPPEDIPVRIRQRIIRIQVTQTGIRPIVQIAEGQPLPSCTTSPYILKTKFNS
jgi:hypothetical protein